MGLWLVENFDPRSCTLQLQNGQSVHITTTDVAAILGLLMGHIEITKRTARAIPEILKEWMWIFEKTTTYMIYHTKSFDYEDNYIDHLWDVENITNLNWCQMEINALVSSKLGWEKNIVKIVGEPILFLMVFYVDRVVPYRRSVLRSFPAFSLGLTQEEQNQRCDDVSAVGRKEVQVANDGGFGVETAQTGEGEVGEQRAHVGERALQIETEITTPTDECLSILEANTPVNATEVAIRKWVFENPHPNMSGNCQRDGKMGSVPEAGLAGAILLQSSRWRVLRRNSKHQDLLSGRQHRNQNQGRPSIHQLSIFSLRWLRETRV
nr:uncharacterized protein LOC109191529 [Ipomoea batatas]